MLSDSICRVLIFMLITGLAGLQLLTIKELTATNGTQRFEHCGKLDTILALFLNHQVEDF